MCTTDRHMDQSKEEILGEYQCIDCDSAFEITKISQTAYDGWIPVCPVCGFDDNVREL